MKSKEVLPMVHPLILKHEKDVLALFERKNGILFPEKYFLSLKNFCEDKLIELKNVQPDILFIDALIEILNSLSKKTPTQMLPPLAEHLAKEWTKIESNEAELETHEEVGGLKAVRAGIGTTVLTNGL